MSFQITENLENNEIISLNVKLNNSHIGTLKDIQGINDLEYVLFKEFTFSKKIIQNYNDASISNFINYDENLVIYPNKILFVKPITSNELFSIIKNII